MLNKIFIGDNYNVMSSEKFAENKGKVDFIYIDPPYIIQNNTFVYSDKNINWSSDIREREVLL